MGKLSLTSKTLILQSHSEDSPSAAPSRSEPLTTRLYILCCLRWKRIVRLKPCFEWNTTHSNIVLPISFYNFMQYFNIIFSSYNFHLVMVGLFSLPSFTWEERHTWIISSLSFENCILYLLLFIHRRLYLSVKETGHRADFSSVPAQDEHWCTRWLLRNDFIGYFRIQMIVFICIRGT